MNARSLAAALLLFATAVAQSDPSKQEEPFFKPFDRAAYETAAQKLGATDAQLQAFAQQVTEVGAARAGDDLVRKLLPAFDAAVKRVEAADPAGALELAKVLAATTDPVAQAHVRYHLSRVFLDGDDPESAVDVLFDYLEQNRNRTPLDGEAAFFYAQALAEIPRADLAVPRFRAFLKWFPEASERFRSTAQQRIKELEIQQDSRLHKLADEMKKTTRDLKKPKTDEPVQTDQLEYVKELAELIEMYEEMERQGGGAPSGNQQSSGPAEKSALVDGEARIGSLDKKTAVSDRWGNMKDKDREKIEAEVQNSLPPQYRKMLEEYYKKLGTGGDK